MLNRAIYPEELKVMFAKRRCVGFISAALIVTALIGFVLAGFLRAQFAFAAGAAAKGKLSVTSRGNDSGSETQNRQAEMRQAYGRLPMNFEVNQGQASPEVKFLARGRGYQVFLTETEAALVLRSTNAKTNNGAKASPQPASRFDRDPQSSVLRFKLQNARAGSRVSGTEMLRGKSNYLIGNDPKKWRTEIANYSRVEYVDVYPGVNLAYYGTQQTLEYDFIVKPGADPKQITMSVEGAEKVDLAENGDIVLQVGGEKVLHRSPLVYQDYGEARRNVPSRYVLKGGNQIGFVV
jgi:hypothetical protein